MPMGGTLPCDRYQLCYFIYFLDHLAYRTLEDYHFLEVSDMGQKKYRNSSIYLLQSSIAVSQESAVMLGGVGVKVSLSVSQLRNSDYKSIGY